MKTITCSGTSSISTRWNARSTSRSLVPANDHQHHNAGIVAQRQQDCMRVQNRDDDAIWNEKHCFCQSGIASWQHCCRLTLLRNWDSAQDPDAVMADDYKYMGDEEERDYNHTRRGRRRKRLLINHHDSNQRLVSIVLSNSHHRQHTQV